MVDHDPIWYDDRIGLFMEGNLGMLEEPDEMLVVDPSAAWNIFEPLGEYISVESYIEWADMYEQYLAPGYKFELYEGEVYVRYKY